MDNTFSSYKIDDRSLVAFIKREIHNLALESGFTQHRAGELDIIVAELTSNLIKFAGEGELLYRVKRAPSSPEIEIFCIDSAIGIENVGKVMSDGFSSVNTLGQGLGAIKRLSNDFQIYSLKNWGTVQYVKICGTSYPPGIPTNFNVSAIKVNCPGENVCGDSYAFKNIKNGFQIFVGDGLGHGINALEAAEMAKEFFNVTSITDPVEILRQMHEHVKKTRGLVATIVSVDEKAAIWSICGVGNISTRIYTGMENKTYNPYNGIVGHNMPRTLNTTTFPYEKYQMVVMHSDGLKTRWDLNNLSSILKHEPGIVAASIYKGNVRGNDDVTILVGKVN